METGQVIILGAGIGGLCTAIALQQHGFEATAYEKAKKLGDVGAGLTLWSNALKVLRSLGLADQVIGAGSKLTRSQLRVSTGGVLQDVRTNDIEEKFGEPVVAIHRTALHNILTRALRPNTLKLDMEFDRFSQDDKGIKVEFTNGDSASADILVGADGIHSAVRRQMFPHIQTRYSGYTAWRGVVEAENEAVLGLTSESWGVGERFGIVRVDKERVYWYATANQPAGERTSGEQRKSKLLKNFEDWHDPIQNLLEATPADSILQNDIDDISPFSSWTLGRVTLLGDSAHPTTPNMGQGACMAIESAYVLARALQEEADYPSAFDRYERERHARTAWITNQSWTIGKGGQIGQPLLCGLRNYVVKLMPPDVLQKNIQRAAGFDVTKNMWK